MSGLPDSIPEEEERVSGREDETAGVASRSNLEIASPSSTFLSPAASESDAALHPAEPVSLQSDVPPAEVPLFANFERDQPLPLWRIPGFLHLLVFLVMIVGGYLSSAVVVFAGMHFHLFGVSTLKQAENEIHYRLGSQAAWYLLTVLECMAVFPLLWRRGFFDGLQWRATAAIHNRWRLLGAAFACFVVAIVDEILIPGPANTPIDQTFRMPGAVWLLFGFGVTLAPLIEEIAFRGFLLPILCTACDWTIEALTGSRAPQPDENGSPQWSLPAMIVASVLTSIPFALMHGEQTSYSIGPFLLLVAISLVLCWVRLNLRSLAASVMVHSSYNLLLFSMMFLGTGGFRHLDKM
jgi:membrane protease YdiL (CAAX protease family)